MIVAGVGLSTERRAAAAAEAAAAAAVAPLQGEPADWCVAFVTADHAANLPALLAALSHAAGTPYVAGCSAAGVLADGREVDEGSAVGVLAVRSDGLRGTPFLFHDEGDRGLTAGVRVGQRLAASRETGDLVLLWPDPRQVRPDRLLQGLDAALGPIAAAGGAASAREPAAATFQFGGADCAAGAVAGIRLGGRFRHQVAVSQGCRPLSEPLLVTRAHDNLILEIEGRPALDVLKQRAPTDVAESPGWLFGRLVVGLIPGTEGHAARPGEYVTRNLVAVDPDTGVLAISDVVEEGQSVLFALREARASRDGLERVVERCRAERARCDWRFGLYFNCLARGRALYGKDDVDAQILAAGFPGLPILGFGCAAEIAPLRGVNQVFTYSGVLVLVGE